MRSSLFSHDKREVGGGSGGVLLLMRRAWHNQTGWRAESGAWDGGTDVACDEMRSGGSGGISSHGSSLEEREDASVRMLHPPTGSLMMRLPFLHHV